MRDWRAFTLEMGTISLQVNMSTASKPGGFSACYISFTALSASLCTAVLQTCKRHKPAPSVTEHVSSPHIGISPANQAAFPRAHTEGISFPSKIKSNAVCSK